MTCGLRLILGKRITRPYGWTRQSPEQTFALSKRIRLSACPKNVCHAPKRKPEFSKEAEGVKLQSDLSNRSYIFVSFDESLVDQKKVRTMA